MPPNPSAVPITALDHLAVSRLESQSTNFNSDLTDFKKLKAVLGRNTIALSIPVTERAFRPTALTLLVAAFFTAIFFAMKILSLV